MTGGFNITAAVCAPEYFPRLEYIALADAVDVFVIADTFQYSRQSYQNRSEIRTPEGRHWLTIPLKGGQHGVPIHEAQVADDDAQWRRSHLRSFEFNYRSSPYFDFFEAEIRNCLPRDAALLVEYTVPSVQCVLDMLEVRTKVVRASGLTGAPRTVKEIAEAVGATQLIALPDGARQAALQGVDVEILSPVFDVYRQNFGGFEPGLSAIDVIMNVGPGETRRMMRSSF